MSFTTKYLFVMYPGLIYPEWTDPHPLMILATYGTAQRPDGMHAFTLGLQKLSLPELEITGLDPAVARLAGEFLLSVAQGVLQGRLITSGARLGGTDALFEARQGGHDRGCLGRVRS